MKRGTWHALGFVSYRSGLAIQDRVADERVRNLRPDTLLLLEHPPTITLGRRASDADVLWNPERLERSGISLERVGRGGGATVHVPGQLVGYPIVRLPHGGRAVRAFVAGLEALLLDVAAELRCACRPSSGAPRRLGRRTEARIDRHRSPPWDQSARFCPERRRGADAISSDRGVRDPRPRDDRSLSRGGSADPHCGSDRCRGARMAGAVRGDGRGDLE